MRKTVSSFTVLGVIFSVFAFSVSLWMMFFKTSAHSIPEQTVYWFLIALFAAVLPNIKQLKWKDLEVQLDRLDTKVDEISNRRYANLVYMIDPAGAMAIVYHKTYGVWLPCGTRLGLYERPHEAVHRAINEELGLSKSKYAFWPPFESDVYGKVTTVPCPYQVQEEAREHRDGIPSHYDFVYICTTQSERPEISSDENIKPRWITLPELKQEIVNSKSLKKITNKKKSELVTFEDVVKTYEKILIEMGLEKPESD